MLIQPQFAAFYVNRQYSLSHKDEVLMGKPSKPGKPGIPHHAIEPLYVVAESL
ncbi:hypothetical protein IQ270_09815 [Microcoleus sp. LEGE 07076]|uniref:hypothetical protein n=1 Tax=Microcoleus sp. LEGE 07076 TaxID=915322 RepID=UPI00187FB84E|nr:hypothetical protein [Microcoleus sp. LEGE 07076]MBE9185002.1 hypothetical protein [Microcoleus sp. LEGE 07076]